MGPHRSGNLSKHFIVHRDRHNHFYLTSNEKFSTVEELIRFYQNVDNGDKYWLGGPLYTQQALNKMKEENLTDDQVLKNRDNSRRREPNSLPFYHGTMCATAATKMLMRESPGTFLVRKLINSDNFYLSYKTVSGKEIIHSKINSTEGSYYSVSEAPPSTSLRRLVESLKRRGILTIGLTQLGKNTFSPSNSLDHGQEDIPL